MPKRGKNIYLRKDGRWEGRFIKERVDGKARYGYVFGKSYEEAEKKLDEAAAMTPSTGSIEECTFSNLSAEYMDTMSPQLKASSKAKYSNLLDLYLIPRFGEQMVVNVSRSDVVLMSRELLLSGGAKHQGLAPKTVNSVLSLMKNVMEYGSREKGITIADITDIAVKQPQKPMRILTREEQATVSDYLKDNLTECNLGIFLCLYTGLRIGEVCALRWEDIHIPEKYLYVHQTMQRIQVKGNPKKKTEVVIQPPKSDCSIRSIPIPEEIIQLLLPVKKENNAFLLTGLPCVFIEPRCLENQFKAVIKECHIKDVNFHALRHTFATRCVELGFDIKSLSEILGHASVNITLNRYVHPSMDLKQQNMNKLCELLTTK